MRMNERKQHVIIKAHQLFIEKGIQSTSIQDIIEYSGISKGTFYNYFSSKNDLITAIFKTIYKKMEMGRNNLLLGKDPSDLEVFTNQIVYHLRMNRANKLMHLIEEVVFLHDEELKGLVRRGHLKFIQWLYERMIDIFGEDKKPFLLDCAIMYKGILSELLKRQRLGDSPHSNLERIVQYSIDRLIHLVHSVADKEDQLFPPDLLDSWLFGSGVKMEGIHHDVSKTIKKMKKMLANHVEKKKYIQLLNFIEHELLHHKEPRRYLLESIFLSLNSISHATASWKSELYKLEKLVMETANI
jgi:AcrR family transcriptional regulator